MSTSENDRGLRLLSLDGGGIRGLSELLIIEEIMKRVQSQLNLQDIPRPAEYFDLIGGTSTGGLIAILLGRLGLSTGEAIDVYTRLAERIFSEKKRKWQDGTFKATVLEREIKKVVGERLGPDQLDARMLEDKDQVQGCKMFVCATPALNVAFPRRFRNYRVRRHEAHNCTIWEAGRATSAAPTFFKRIEIGGEQFVDAGLGCNNPIKEVIAEAQLVFGKEKKVDFIISIGTGKSGVVGFDKPAGFQTILPLDLVDVLRKMATESSKTAEEMEQRYEDAADFYFRFDVDQGLQDVGLDEWRQLGAVKTHTIAYTMETNVNKKIDAVVGKLTSQVSLQTYNLAELGGQIFSVKASLRPASNIPFPRDLDFVDRGDIMIQIHDKLSYPGARVALHGLGGKGKSQLAIEYAHRIRDRFPQTWVFWIYASNHARMEQGFEEIAGILDLPGRDNPKANIFQIVGEWLKGSSKKWLLVLDNADHPIMFSKFAREEKVKEEKAKGNPGPLTFPPLVTPHLPHTQNGSILVTSRNEEVSLALVGEDKNIIHVGEMNEKESLELLLKKLNEKVDQEGALDLVKALDHIPLAITQAAAFLSRQKGRVSIPQYVENFKSNEKIIRLLKPEFTNPRRDESATNSTITTWQISFDHIRENWPSASEMLSLMSFFNYQGVPEFLLHDSQGPALSGSVEEVLNEDFEKCVQILRDYCLISLGEDISTFRMHRLVQASTQDWLKSHGNHDVLRRRYLRIMSNALPQNIYEDWGSFRQLLPHVESVSSQEQTDKDSTENWARILSAVSRYKSFLGSFGEAEETIREVVKRTERLFGESNRVTLNALNGLSFVLIDRGKLDEAEETIRRLVEGTGKLVDESDPAMQANMDLLAVVLTERGKHKEAETILRSVVEAARRGLPEDDPDVLHYLNNLAGVVQKQGNHKEAEAIYRRVLEKEGELCHEDSLNTLTTWNNLARALLCQEKFQEAEKIFRGMLERREMLFGPNAPWTIRSRINLASLLNGVGKYVEAERIGRQALEEAERVFGKEHPDTFDCLCALAGALRCQEHFTEAEQMFRRASEGLTKCFGKGNPKTLEAMRQLQAVLLEQIKRKGGKSE